MNSLYRNTVTEQGREIPMKTTTYGCGVKSVVKTRGYGGPLHFNTGGLGITLIHV